MRQLQTDFPVPAYDRAIRAFDEFDACAAEYRLLLDTQRAMLASENFPGTGQTMARGDAIARRAAQAARQISPVREALTGGLYAGPRVKELRRRLAASGAIAELIGSSVAQISAACVVKRDAAAAQLGDERVAQKTRGRLAYAAPVRSATAIDIRH